jgi:hypothetical protein
MPWNPFRRTQPEALSFRLAFEPIPENGAALADDVLPFIKQASGIDLDYSIESLDVLDGILEDIRGEDPTGTRVREMLFGLGCYVGEVFVRHADGRWRSVGETPLAKVETLPLVVELPNGNVLNPIGKVFKRVQLGAAENVRWFYDALATGG